MIARELVTKLGFSIDFKKFEQYKKLQDQFKPKIDVDKISTFGLGNDVIKRFSELKKGYIQEVAYKQELSNLGKDERTEILAFNKLEKQAIKEVTKEKQLQYREIAKLQSAQIAEQQRALTGMKRSVGSFGIYARRLALGVVGFGGLGISGAFRDFEAQKKGEKTKSGVLFNSRQMQEMTKLHNSLTKIQKTGARLRNQFMFELSPALNENLMMFNKWFDQNHEGIGKVTGQVFQGAIRGISGITAVLKPVVTTTNDIVEGTIGWKNATTLAVGAYTGYKTINGISSIYTWLKGSNVEAGKLNTSLKAISVIAKTLKAVGLAAIAEDIFTFFQGGDSITGRIVNPWKNRSDGFDKWKEKDKVDSEALRARMQGLFMNHLGLGFDPAMFSLLGKKFNAETIKPPKYILDFNKQEQDKQVGALYSGYAGDFMQSIAKPNVSKSVVMNSPITINIENHGGANTSNNDANNIVAIVKREIESKIIQLEQQEMNAIGVYH